MSNSQQWHYTDQSGQQAGPIPTDELLQLIASKSVPLTAMAWKEGMANWKPVSQIEELQAGTSTPPPSPDPVPNPAPTQAPGNIQEPNQNPINPYETPQVPSDEEFYEATSTQTESYDGTGRFGFLIGYPLLYLILFGAPCFLGQLLELNILTYGAFGVWLIMSIRLTCLRFINIGMSGWWTLGLFIPILNILLLLALNILPPGFSETRKLDIPAYIIGFFNLFPIIAIICLIVMGSFAELVGQLMEFIK